MPLSLSDKMEENKKKISQSELRRFMSAHKRKASENTKKIESPLAKYSDSGELTCIACNSVVKTEAIWGVHINSKKHKESIKKSLVQGAAVPTSLSSEKVLPPVEVVKKTKSILKNARPLPPKFFDDIKTEQPDQDDDETPKKKAKLEVDSENNEVPMDEGEAAATEESKDHELPEGFFDDPVLDAKARNVEYKDPVEEEWERFQKEIKEETDLSARMINDDTEDATVQRQIEQIDEQMTRLSKVVQLEIKKEEVKAKLLNRMEVVKKEEPESDESDVSDMEGEFDWRAKRYLC
ncbi:zinc finger protein 830 [Halyomorpha halys]|uniref:zinc finger protein 830 n=1 Tax=Halyomorpha halys TaxID=286706 RepID=UPI0006D5102F|nr:zinc finger protein 830 [Halyomorpha halys]